MQANVIAHSDHSDCDVVASVSLYGTGLSKKVLAKFGDTCPVRAGGLCISCPKSVGSMNAGNSSGPTGVLFVKNRYIAAYISI